MSLEQMRPLGSQGFKVSRLGLGCMGLSAFYGTPVQEEALVGKAIKHFPRERIQLATKFGNIVENGVYSVKGSAEYVRQACEASLKRLDVEYIDLYYQHRVDKLVPIEETVGELKKLVEEGKSTVQLEWSLWSRDAEEDLVPICSPLGRGFFSEKGIFEALDATDARMRADSVPIPGTTKTKNFDENLAALKVRLSKKDLEEISAAVQASEVSGERNSGEVVQLTYKYGDTPPLKL
ncbi:hypothetical protein GOP47_0024842 [Adiantum capillus-veneris]|uniref:NADP-dependent oxidoreductase domain-containing protein n=1 Tax=Adiantum capillus-veneris TaxID=13818 RepID=A0A9D4U305_ADICA|nr:hypothetical protein GOP47_0024842 [Adiantum capillus-veneris]